MVDEKRVKSEVVGRVLERVRARAALDGGRPVEEVVNETLYQERERLKRSRLERAESDRAFYARVQRELPKIAPVGQTKLLKEVIERYAAEICGHFDERVYTVTTRALPTALNLLLTSLSPQRVLRELSVLSNLDEHLVLEGEIESLKALEKLGTVVLVPTHSSNFDSVLMGYAIFRMGLPPVTYGAGLNLFSNPIIGFFMRHLGAYTVDRLKTDPLYRETLKEYTTVVLEEGQDLLFFPGGTRSRSGAVERHLKKGLLGCALAAYRNNLARQKSEPNVFLVPATLSYPLVLEASTLIDDYLAETGRHRYIIIDDEFSRWQRWMAFLRGLIEMDLRIHLRVGRPLDPFGNDVDLAGRSLDPKGRPLDPSKYLENGAGELVDDPRRDAEYTKALSARIVGSFRANNVVQPTHVVAFAVFELLRRAHPGMDLYRLLRTVNDDLSLAQADVEREVERLLGEIATLARDGKLERSSSVAESDVAEVLRQALRSFGTYHTQPVIERRGVRLHPGDPRLIFYYRNRLEGYGLLGAPDLVPSRREP